MEIKKSELRKIIKEQVSAFFVTPEALGVVSRRKTLDTALRGHGFKSKDNEVDEKELDRAIQITMQDLEAGAASRMRSKPMDEARKLPHAPARGYKGRAKVNKKEFIKKVQSLVPKNKAKSLDMKKLNNLYDSGSSPEDAVKDLLKKEISGVDSLKPNDPRTPGAEEVEKIAAKDVMEADPKKKGGRPRGGPHIENVRFWDLPENSLRYIIKDASEAVRVNPTARKANKYADEINDAVTVLYWRKKKGIKEEYIQLIVTEAEKEGKRITALRKILKGHTAGKIDGQIVDAFTAGGLVKLYDKLDEKNHPKFERLPLPKLVEFMWKQVRR